MPVLRFAAARAAGARFSVSHLRVTTAAFGTSIQVSGVVKNTTRRIATNGIVAVILLDATGAILAGLIDSTSVRTLQAGKSAAFETSYPLSPPLVPGRVRRMIAIAFDLSSP